MKQHEKVKKIAVTGLLSALVFLFSWVQIPIGDVARLHLGNVFCALSGLLFGPLVGGIASGFGSMLFDFTNPAYIAESWITFITKFAIGFLAGVIAKRSAAGRAGGAGQLHEGAGPCLRHRCGGRCGRRPEKLSGSSISVLTE